MLKKLKESDVKSILIIGIAGGLAHLTCERLRGQFPNATIHGVDSRKIRHHAALKGVHCNQIRYSRGAFEKLFRNHTYDVVFHLARLSHARLSAPMTLGKRLEMSLVGTQTILDLSLKHGVSKVIILSTFHVYGAYSDNPAFMSEETPLRASMDFSDLRDVVEMDFLATNWMWKHQNKIETLVFRPCNIVGSKVKNAITLYLKNGHSPYPIDYNPAFQFIHENDMAEILSRSTIDVPTGVYNVAPDGLTLIREALTICKNRGLPIPLSIITPLAKIMKGVNQSFPNYLIEYLKYPCLIDNSLLKQHIRVPYLSNTDSLRML